jgi:hypothetical protein
MVSAGRLLLAAACLVLALGLPFGRPEAGFRFPDTVLAQPLLVTEPGTRGYGPNGEPLAIPGRLRIQYVPLLVPGWSAPSVGPPPGRAVTARVPLVALLAAALLVWRRRSPALARRAAFAGGVALAATGVLPALPSTGAIVSIFGVALLATVGVPSRHRSAGA